MTCSFSKSIDGYRFEVMSDSWSMSEPSILVPVTVAETVDSETLGRYIKELIEDAWSVKASSLAEWVVAHSRQGLSAGFLEESKDEIALIERFVGEDNMIDRAIMVINEARTKAAHRRAVPAKRREIQHGYSRFFIAIGRRDGFYCAHCKRATNDLQVDHKLAVVKGGGNELDNLQLLCSTCNAVKGDRQ